MSRGFTGLHRVGSLDEISRSASGSDTLELQSYGTGLWAQDASVTRLVTRLVPRDEGVGCGVGFGCAMVQI